MRALAPCLLGWLDRMRTFTDAKAMATTLRDQLAADGVEISHSAALELVAKQFGLPDWNVLSTRIKQASSGIRLEPAIPILRIFDVAKADEFYGEFLGFAVDWDHRFEENFPLYRQISRTGTILHLSEHHGDSSPGSTVWIPMHSIEEFHRELRANDYRYAKPGLNEDAPGGPTVEVSDPFGNRLRFCQRAGGQ